MLALPCLSPQKLLEYGFGHGKVIKKSSTEHLTNTNNSTSLVVHAVERDSQRFEVDPDKAKEALQQLDQQLQSLSNKKVSSPKIKASDVKLTKDQMMAEEPPEISGSFLAYTAIFLFGFTFFYNVLFYAVIKPAIDGPESVPASSEERTSMSDAALLQFLPSSVQDNVLER